MAPKQKQQQQKPFHNLTARTLHINHVYDLLFFTIYFAFSPFVYR